MSRQTTIQRKLVFLLEHKLHFWSSFCVSVSLDVIYFCDQNGKRGTGYAHLQVRPRWRRGKETEFNCILNSSIIIIIVIIILCVGYWKDHLREASLDWWIWEEVCCNFGCWGPSLGFQHFSWSHSLQRLGHCWTGKIWWTSGWLLHPG